MKRFIFLMMSMVVFSTAFAGRDRAIDPDKLPEKSKTFLKEHFPDKKISFAKMDGDWEDRSYEVILSNGYKVEFTYKGEWKKIDCKYDKVPDAIVPKQILKYMSESHKDNKIVEIEKKRRGYEVELDNDIDIKFDSQFKVLKYD